MVRSQQRGRRNVRSRASFHGFGSAPAWSRRCLAGCLALSGLLIACTGAGAPAPPTTVSATSAPTQAITTESSPPTAAQSAPQTLQASPLTAVVRRGAIEETVRLIGRVVTRDELSVTAPAITGTRRVLVAPGQTVTEGQPLLETNSTDRRQPFDEIRDREQAAARRAEAAQARIQERERQAAEGLSRMPRPGALAAELQIAQSTVLQASAGLERAEADLAALTAPPSAVDVRVADQQVRTAELALQRAEADRERVLDGPSDDELLRAERDVAAAEADVRRATDAARKLEAGADASRVQSARRSVLLAQSALQAAHQPPPEIVAAQELVREVRNRSVRERRAVQSLARQQVEIALARQRLEIERAEEDLAAAVRGLQEATRGPEAQEVEATSRDVEIALRRLSSARERVAVLRAGPSQLDLDTSTVAVETAQATLEQAQARRAALEAGPAAGHVAPAQAAVTSAQAALTVAEGWAAELANQQLNQERELGEAQALLSLLQGIRSGAIHAPDEAAKPDADPDIVEFAEAQRELAEARQGGATIADAAVPAALVAPAAGVVTSVLTGPGEEIGPAKPALTMVKTGDLVVQASLEAPDGPRVMLGMPARVRLRSLPGTEVAATVDRVDAAPGNRSAQYAVTWPSTPPPIGAEAEAITTIQRRENAVLVPSRAVRTEGGRMSVDVMEGTTRRRVEVSLGLVADEDVEIVGGVQEGQRVVLDP